MDTCYRVGGVVLNSIMSKMSALNISQVMGEMGRRGVKKRFAGKSKEEISEMMRNVVKARYKKKEV